MRAIGILGALAPLCLTASCTLLLGNVDFDGTNSTSSTTGSGGTGGTGSSSTSGSGGATGTTGSGGHAGGMVCEPFTQKACYDADPSTLLGACHAGKQTCSQDGSGYGPCAGQVTPAGEDDCVNKADTSCDGKLSCACTPKATEPCYDGAPGTDHHLPCKAGTRTCADDGSGWGGCVGEVTPRPTDDCTTQEDENCDGVVNDFCVCQTGQTQACYTGKSGTENVGLCRGGTQVCNATGTGWDAACTGEVTPQAEQCSVKGDEDCDGISCSEVVWADLFATGDTGGSLTNFRLAVDGAGNTFLSVYEGGAFDFGNGVSLPANGAGFGLVKIGPDGKALWAKDGVGGALATDAQGNVYVASQPGMTVASYDGAGNLRWSKSVATGNGFMQAIQVSSITGIVITGTYAGTLSFGSGALALPSSTGTDGFVARLNTAGGPVWAQRVTDASGQAAATQNAAVVALDLGGQIFVAGGFVTSVALGTMSYVNTGTNDFYVAKLDKATGAPVWLKEFGSAGGDGVAAIAVDSAGNPLVVGAAGSSANFGGATLASHGGRDVFLLKLDATGSHVWSKLLGSSGDDVGQTAVFDSADDIVLAGTARGTSFSLGCGSSTGPGLFLGKLDPMGNCLWSKTMGDARQDPAIVGTRAGGRDIFLAAFNAGTIDLGTGPLTTPVTAYESLVLGRFQP